MGREGEGERRADGDEAGGEIDDVRDRIRPSLGADSPDRDNEWDLGLAVEVEEKQVC